jgi:hypothetical protein
LESIELKVSLVPVFVQSNLPNTDYNRYLVLLDKDRRVLSTAVSALDSIDGKLEELYSDYIKFSFDWPAKHLADCRKTGAVVEISYSCRLPMMKGCVKQGCLVNFKEFFELGLDQYYGTIVSRI